jgi:hypothetical protein
MMPFDNTFPYLKAHNSFGFGSGYEPFSTQPYFPSPAHRRRHQRPCAPQAPDRYAKKVAGGYRPPRTEAFDDSVWALVESCWAQDPLDRPTAAEVVPRLEALLAACKAAGGAPAAKASCAVM